MIALVAKFASAAIGSRSPREFPGTPYRHAKRLLGLVSVYLGKSTLGVCPSKALRPLRVDNYLRLERYIDLRVSAVVEDLLFKSCWSFLG